MNLKVRKKSKTAHHSQTPLTHLCTSRFSSKRNRRYQSSMYLPTLRRNPFPSKLGTTRRLCPTTYSNPLTFNTIYSALKIGE